MRRSTVKSCGCSPSKVMTSSKVRPSRKKGTYRCQRASRIDVFYPRSAFEREIDVGVCAGVCSKNRGPSSKWCSCAMWSDVSHWVRKRDHVSTARPNFKMLRPISLPFRPRQYNQNNPRQACNIKFKSLRIWNWVLYHFSFCMSSFSVRCSPTSFENKILHGPNGEEYIFYMGSMLRTVRVAQHNAWYRSTLANTTLTCT